MKFHFWLDFSAAMQLNFIMDLAPGIETLSPGQSSHKNSIIPKSGITEKSIIQSLETESCWAPVNIRNYPFINKIISIYRRPASHFKAFHDNTRRFCRPKQCLFFGKHPCLCYNQVKHQYLKKLLCFCLFTVEKYKVLLVFIHCSLYGLFTQQQGRNKPK